MLNTSRADLQPSPLLPRPKPMPEWLWRRIGWMTGIERLERMYRQMPAGLSGAEFVDAALDTLDVKWTLTDVESGMIPASGPLVVTANHPYGGIDGLAAIAALARVRPDLKVIATTQLGRIKALEPYLITVDNFGSVDAAKRNLGSVRRILRHVWQGGALLIFPAGEVAHLDIGSRCIVDPPWKRSALALLRLAKAPVMPLYVHGSNGVGFQLAGLVHPALRTLLLPREVSNKQGAKLDLRLGAPISPERIAAFENETILERFLRIRLYSLAAPRPVEVNRLDGRRIDQPVDAIVESGDPEALALEVHNLPESAHVASLGPLKVYVVVARQSPRVLAEIGRLREITFRAVGEGTGRETDLDRFDQYYEHLFAWDTRKDCIVGAYRLARTDLVRKRFGRNALYLSTLFDIGDAFFKLLGPAIELGRSFVRPEYQRGLTPLLALWSGIAEYVSRHPRYAKLIGPVSISADYDLASRDMLVRYLKWHHFDPLLGAFLRSRTPFRPAGSLGTLNRELAQLGKIEELAQYWPDESSGRARSVPVLLRQYLKLGGKVIGFNVDPTFGNCLDCLTVVDLKHTPDQVLAKYMSPPSLARFRRYPDMQKVVGVGHSS